MPLPTAELPSGSLFAGRYQIIDELGLGGMGRVYRVLDTKLNEEVALKIIRPEIAADREVLERFAAELKLARQIVHRNVARMFDLNEYAGVPYITMEYVRGENLKRLIRQVDHLSPAQAIAYACQICDGLAEAHRSGIVHRDLKPQNIMIDEEGQAKILDFGLARLLAQEAVDSGGSRSGTPAYVSPQQIKGEPADARSDIYSLGVMIYEMLTGHPPFRSERLEEIIDAHLHELPEAPHGIDPGISTELSALVLKCMEKIPGARYQTAEELGQALGCLRSRPRKGGIQIWILEHRPASVVAGLALLALAGYWVYKLIIPPAHPPASSSLAILRTPVLPAADPGPLRHFQDTLSVKLAGIQGLNVIPTRTVNAVDTEGSDSRRIGRLLRADYLIEPACRIEGSKVTFSASLINTRLNRPVRAYEFARERDDPSATEEEFARGLAIVLRYDIADDRVRKSEKGVSNNLDARLLVHEGRILVEDRYLDSRDPADFEAAISKFKQALVLDPEYALAFYALGNAYEIHYNNPPPRGKDPRDVDLMCAYYSQAYSKDWSSPETNIGLCWASFNRGEFTKARDYLKNALRLEPRTGIVDLSVGAFLRSIGLYAQAIPYLSRAAKFTPNDPEPIMQIAKCYAALGHFDRAARRSMQGVATEPNNVRLRQFYVMHLILARRLEEAGKEIATISQLDPGYSYLPFDRALLAAARGDQAKALALKGSLESLGMPGTCFYLFLGMADEALANIEAGIDRAFEASGDYLYSYPSLVGNPAFKSLRDMPRFQDIVRRQKERYERELRPFADL
jgi:tetratricopeptide (TPR) repeat protein